MKTKRCSKCKKIKLLAKFSKNKARKDGHSSWCKHCRNEYYKGTVAPYEIKRNYDLNHQYGISLKEYNNLLEKQNSCCAICGIHQSTLKRKLCVDHDHCTKRVRGLLCPTCNMKIGILEQLDFITNAKGYLVEPI